MLCYVKVSDAYKHYRTWSVIVRSCNLSQPVRRATERQVDSRSRSYADVISCRRIIRFSSWRRRPSTRFHLSLPVTWARDNLQLNICRQRGRRFYRIVNRRETVWICPSRMGHWRSLLSTVQTYKWTTWRAGIASKRLNGSSCFYLTETTLDVSYILIL